MDEQENLELNLDDIMNEFGEALPQEEPLSPESEDTAPVPADFQEPTIAFSPLEAPDEIYDSRRLPPMESMEDYLGGTVPIDLPPEPEADEAITVGLPPKKGTADFSGDTIRLGDLSQIAQESAAAPVEPFSETWEPEYESPIGEYVPPQPIVFKPRSRLRELKRQLIAGPERRYYELSEIGVGKIQALMFLSLLMVVLSIGTTAMYALGSVAESRLKLMIFGQFFFLLISALLGSHRLLDGLFDLLRFRFTLNTMLLFTFIACLVDGYFCLQEQRVPCCAAFSLQVAMSLWSTYHRRSTEMGQMDTLRKANRLDSLTPAPDYHEGTQGLLRGEGRLDDFMNHYSATPTPEKVLCVYAFAACLISIGFAVAAGVLHNSVSFAFRVLVLALLASMPVTAFISVSRPLAILQKRLHTLNTVHCGWQGIRALCRRSAFPLTFDDLFPAGCCKLNGVKFYGDRDPDLVVAYTTALINADGSGLVPLFNQLLDSRNGRHLDAEAVRAYGNGGIGGEVAGESVLVGAHSFLKDMGVEIPEGTRVSQAVYAAIDGELCGVFAVTYGKEPSSAAGIGVLCNQRRLQPTVISGGFMLTESFIRSRFDVNTKRMSFPERAVREELAQKAADVDTPAAALITRGGLAPFAYAVSGARATRTACILGVILQLLGGLLGLAMIVILGVLGESQLLTPANVLLYELIWLVPGFLLTEWNRFI